MRESHMASIAPTEIGTSKIVGTYVHIGDHFTNGDIVSPKTIQESKYPVRYNGMKLAVRFPKSYGGTVTVDLNSKDTATGSATKIASYTVKGDLTGEDFEAVVPENCGGYLSIDVTCSTASTATPKEKISAEFVANV